MRWSRNTRPNCSPRSATAEALTLDELIRATALARHEVVQLAACATGRARTSLIAHGDRPLATAESDALQAMVARRLAGEPLAYLVGRRDFHGRSFRVDRRVLIPRPETELLVDLALAHCDAPASRVATVLDLGTGSGAIAITLALARPRLAVTATDVSPDALEVAACNARDLGAAVRFVASDWYSAFDRRDEAERFDLVVSNPPYIAPGDRHLDEGDLRFEPRHALTDDHDGLDAIRRIVADAKKHLEPSGVLLVEHGHDQAAVVRTLFAAAGFVDVRSSQDLAGIERVVSATTAEEDRERRSADL